MTRLETMMESLVGQIGRELDIASKVHDSIDKSLLRLTQIVERQDRRIDGIERTIAKALGAVAVLVVLINVLAPVIQRLLGISMP